MREGPPVYLFQAEAPLCAAQVGLESGGTVRAGRKRRGGWPGKAEPMEAALWRGAVHPEGGALVLNSHSQKGSGAGDDSHRQRPVSSGAHNYVVVLVDGGGTLGLELAPGLPVRVRVVRGGHGGGQSRVVRSQMR